MLRNSMKTWMTTAVSIALCFVCLGQAIDAQTTAFTYQGKLTDGGSPATGQYDLIFSLFGAPSGGSQVGGDLVRHDVQVTNGVFTVDLDFGSSPFTSTTGHYLEIAVRAGATAGAYTTLVSRQPVTSSPYSVETIRATSAAVADDALQPDGGTASQFVQADSARLSDVRTPTAGSGNDIQNTAAQPTHATFKISRNGTSVSRVRYSPTFSGPGIPAGGVARRSDIPAIFPSRALGAGRRVPTSPPNSGLLMLGGTAGIGQGSPGEYRVHVLTPFNLGLRVQTDALGGNVASFGGNGDFQIDAPFVPGGRFTVKEGGNVGIGTASPTFKLHLVDPSNTGLRVQTNTVGGTVASFGGIGDFQIDAPGVVGGRFAVKENGNAGIGTASPAEKLSVAGMVQSTSGGFKFPDGTTQTSAANATYTIRASTQSSDISPHGSSWGSVLHLNVPAGRYLVLATALFFNSAVYQAQNNSRSWSCRFSGDDPDGYPFTLPGGGSVTATLHAFVFVSSGGVDLECLASTSPPSQSDVSLFFRRLTAVRSEGLHNDLIY